MLMVENLECVRGDRQLFSGVGFSIEKGALRVRGSNGCGKTSLLRILCGLIDPTEGNISWRGESIRTLGEAYYRDMVYIGHRNALKDDLTALENLRVSLQLAQADHSERELSDAMDHMGLSGCKNLPVKMLSQGQRRRLTLSRLLLQKAALWILDEPLVALDRSAVELVEAMINEHVSRGGIVVLTTHQELKVSCVAQQELDLENLPGGLWREQ